MPQQINLATPVLLTQKLYFSAQSLLRALVIFVVLGGALAAYGFWNLSSATQGLQATIDAQAPELANLRAALAEGAAPGAEKVLEQELQAARTLLRERQGVAQELRRGLIVPGQGHAARLQLVAQSIPSQVWVTQVRADPTRLEVTGFTQEPAALNEWVARLGQSQLLRGQQLAQVRVERVVPPVPGAAAPASASVAGGRPAWAFTLASALPVAAASSAGVKP